MQKIQPCLWFDTQAEEAAKFYTSIFKNSSIGHVARYGDSGAEISGQKKGSVMTVDFELAGQKFTGLNGGPLFKFTPAMSFFVRCEDVKEIETLWAKLSNGGSILFELKDYPWAEKYGWCTDKFGVPWQLMIAEGAQKIMPSFLFTGEKYGQGEEAINYYISLFENSKIKDMHRDPKTGSVMHALFSLNGEEFVMMEGEKSQENEITHALSLMINCKNQAEVDLFWDKLGKGGSHEPCGWVLDKFGVPWQVVPTELNEMMTDSDPEKVENVMKSMLKMKKLDIDKLKAAYK